MKLLFAIKTLESHGGAERVLADLTAALAARGHDVMLVSFGSKDAPDFYPIAGRVSRIWLDVGQTQARTSVVEAVKRSRALRRTLNELKPEIAVGFMNSAFVPLALASLGLKTPIIASEHIVYDHFDDRPLDRAMYRLTGPLFERVVFISENGVRGFPRGFRRRAAILPNPVTVHSGAKANVIGPTIKTLLSVGRLARQKDHATLPDAFARVSRRHTDWRLRIVGEGEDRGVLEDQIRSLGLSQRVELSGAVADIASAYSEAQLFVMPSRYESFGLSTAEALAAGLPVVGFADCPGTNELVQSGTNGLLVAGEDRPTALADGLSQLMSSEESRVRMARAAQRSVARFNLENVVNAWEDLFASMNRTTYGRAHGSNH